MKILSKLVSVFCDCAVSLNPTAFARSLNHKHLDALIAAAGKPRSEFCCESANIPSAPTGFEDLAFLFWNTPLNRGLLRQDCDEAALLFKTVRSLIDPKGVEIGRYHGGSTLLLAVAVGPRGKLTSLDLAPRNDESLSRALASAGLSNRVELVVTDANRLEFQEELDFAFIDGDHSYDGARQDHNKWGKLVRDGGYIIHHDMAKTRDFATQWVELSLLRDRILNQQRDFLRLAAEAGSMTVFQRVSKRWSDI
jgi:predicted O-methyltransferase YrrM